MNHFIPLQQAKDMTSRFRKEKENILAENWKRKNILPQCETFDRTAFDRVLAQQGCEQVRIYFGMDNELKVHAIVVGVNANNEDILPSSTTLVSGTSDTDGEGIIEEGTRCPDMCPDGGLNG